MIPVDIHLHFPAMLVTTNGNISDGTSGQFPAMFVATEPVKPKYDLSLILTK